MSGFDDFDEFGSIGSVADMFSVDEVVEKENKDTKKAKTTKKKVEEVVTADKGAVNFKLEDTESILETILNEEGLTGESGIDDQLYVVEDILAEVAKPKVVDLTEEDKADGTELGIAGTIKNRSHVKTALDKTSGNGIKAATEESESIRLNHLVGYKDTEETIPYYNFNENGVLLDLEAIMKENSEYVIRKDTKYMGTLYFKECSKEEAKNMIICGHYSHKFQGYFGVVNVGVYTQGRLVGVASFGGLMNPESYKRFGNFKKGEVIELNRLWIDDELGMNTETMILGASWKIMRKSYPEIKIVQSFADGRLGAGTIYKASNFKYYGVESTKFFQNKVTKVISHKVGIENTKAPMSMCKINKALCQDKLSQFIVSTYRYIFPLYDDISIDLEEYTKSIPRLDKKGKILYEKKLVDAFDASGKRLVDDEGRRYPVALDDKGNEIIKNGVKQVLIDNTDLPIMDKVPEYPTYSISKTITPEEEVMAEYNASGNLLARSYILSYIYAYEDEEGSLADFFEKYITDRTGVRGLASAISATLKNDTIEEFTNPRLEAIKVAIKYCDKVDLESGIINTVDKLSEDSVNALLEVYRDIKNRNSKLTATNIVSLSTLMNDTEIQRSILGNDQYLKISSAKTRYEDLQNRFNLSSIRKTSAAPVIEF